MPSSKIPYADVADVTHILSSYGDDFISLQPSDVQEGARGIKVRLTRSGLSKTLSLLQTAGVAASNPVFNACQTLLSTDMWQSSGGRGRAAIDYRGKVKNQTINGLGAISLRVAGNKNGRGGFFTSIKSGDTVKVSYSKDGKSITITEK